MAREQHHPGDFGSHLRLARERKGVSLRAISDKTRISYPALEALERNDISKLPGGIFSRAFVRSYASEIGLDPETTVEEFVKSFPDDSVTVGHRVTVHLDDLNVPERTRRRARWMRVAAMAVPIIAVAAYLAAFGWPARIAANREATPSAVTGEAPAPLRLLVTMRATTACTLSYVIDGAPSVQVSLPPGSERTLDAVDTLSLDVSDGSALEVQINGDLMKPLGAAGRPAEVLITRDNARSLLLVP